LCTAEKHDSDDQNQDRFRQIRIHFIFSFYFNCVQILVFVYRKVRKER
jgi:hypothetical protein